MKYFLPLFLILIIWSGTQAAFAANVGVNSTTSTNPNQSKIKVVASFYPIYEFVKMVGGNNVNITTLIPIGVEPHDFEPTIQQIQNAESADLIIYNGAGLEKWIDKIDSKFKVDASQGLNLFKGNASESAGTYDPHVWLDPVLAEKEVENIRDALVKVDPANSQYYLSNADKFIAELNNLDN
jgi:zinc transport system substrate-binding protein